jgi:hypothetical protein
MTGSYLTTRQLARRLGMSERTGHQRIALMCGIGRIPGAVKIGRDWIIPADVPDYRKPVGHPRKEGQANE